MHLLSCMGKKYRITAGESLALSQCVPSTVVPVLITFVLELRSISPLVRRRCLDVSLPHLIFCYLETPSPLLILTAVAAYACTINKETMATEKETAAIEPRSPRTNETPLANPQKSTWERIWPSLACGAGLFSDGYLQGQAPYLHSIQL